MKRKNPPLVHSYMTRFGKYVHYLRRPGQKKIRLDIPEGVLPWSPEFLAVREAALKSDNAKIEIGASKTIFGTVNAALVSYYKSSAFKDELAESTQQNRRAILENFRADYGEWRIGLMHADALQKIINKKRPNVQRNFKKAMRGFINYCRAESLIKIDPLKDIELTKPKKSSGYHTWTEDEIAQYQQRHAHGSKARLALEVVLQTGHARADAVRMGRQHVRNGTLSMRRQKTKVQFDIPLLPDLLAELALHPKTDQLAFLTTEHGKPFTAAGFGNKFRDWCNQANLPHCSAHGLRKAAAVRHALNGATAPELMAWFGWKSIGEAQRYIEDANRIKLAESAGAKIISGTAIGSPANPVSQNEAQVIENAEGKK